MSDVSAVAASVLELPATLGRSRLVAIDGPAGSGKSTFADDLRGSLDRRSVTAQILHLDDLYEGWSGLDFASDLERRVLEQVLLPLAEGRAGRWQRYDWHAERFGEWQALPLPEVLIVEGCGSGALAFAPYITLLVWVEANRDTRMARGVERDGADVLPMWLRWMESERRHFAANATRQRAHVHLTTA